MYELFRDEVVFRQGLLALAIAENKVGFGERALVVTPMHGLQ